MTLRNMHRTAGVALLAALAAVAFADDRGDYNERVAARLVGLFQSLDRDANNIVTREESRGDVNFSPRLADMDIDSDGEVTRNELQRYNDDPYGVRLGPR